MPRTAILVLAGIAALAAPTLALPPPSVSVPVDCPFTSGEVSIGVVPEFNPPCMRVPSGGSVTWTNAGIPGLGAVQHHPTSIGDQGRCFFVSIALGQSRTVTFYYDGIHASSVSGRIKENCDGALHPLLSIPGAALIRYTCGAHGLTAQTAYIMVEAA